jgi:ComF family protein
MAQLMTNGIFSDFISLFFPRYCYACMEQLLKTEECICLNCRHELPKTNYHLEDLNPMMIKMYGKAPVVFGSSYLRFVKSGKVQRLLHQLKYKNRAEIGNILGECYGSDLSSKMEMHNVDLVVPVPLHKNKLKKRGYNQSEGFAKGLSRTLGIEMRADILTRVKHSTTQTKKSKIARWENVENIFKVGSPLIIVDKHILLVDDVITTGATLASCANELLVKGAASVSVVTIAVAEYF